MPTSSALLIRAPDAEKPDRYETAFSEAGFSVASVAALDTGFVNDDSLDAAIRGRASEFDGAIRQLRSMTTMTTLADDASDEATRVGLDLSSQVKGEFGSPIKPTMIHDDDEVV